jgi:hypothetical protein
MDQAERIRVYFRAIIAFYFMGAFGYVLYKYVGMEDGMIQPDVVYSWLTGLIMGFIAFYFAGEAIKKE